MLVALTAALLAVAPPIPIPPLPVGEVDWGQQLVERAEAAERRLARHGFRFEGESRACLWAHLGLTVARGLTTAIGSFAQRHASYRPGGIEVVPGPDRSIYPPQVQTQLNKAVKHFERIRDEKCGGPPPQRHRSGHPVATNSADPKVQEALEWLHAHPERPNPARLALEFWWYYLAPVPKTPQEALEAGVLFAGSIAIVAMTPAQLAALVAAVVGSGA